VTHPVVDAVSAALRRAGVAADAGPMQAYMKTATPFFGVKATPRRRLVNAALAAHPVSDEAWEPVVRALFERPHREEKYAAIDVALKWKRRLTRAALPLLEHLIREGGWWDLVDGPAINGVGFVLLNHRATTSPLLERWVDDPDLWIRRTAIIAHIKHRAATDEAQLFDFCRRRCHEREFFIRKGIGWALRDYSYAAPEAVTGFLRAERERLSGLSFREGAKKLRRDGVAI